MEVKGGYTFYWIGRPENEPRQSGVGFAIRNSIARNLESLPVGVNDRLMTLRLPIDKNNHATLISAYAPTMSNPEDNKERFYSDLRSVLLRIPRNDKIFLLGDFNARVGNDNLAWPSVLGPHGFGKMNSNGLLLLSLCSEFNLTITNTLFQQANKYKTTWKHPRSGHWHMLDYVIVSSRHRRDVRLTRSHRGTECWSDHRLVRSKLNLSIHQKIKSKRSIVKKLDVSSLREHIFITVLRVVPLPTYL